MKLSKLKGMLPIIYEHYKNYLKVEFQEMHGSNSIIYQSETAGNVLVYSTDYAKLAYYQHALENKYRHIPKIEDLLHDTKYGLIFICREKLYPVMDTKKLARIDKIKKLIDRVETGIDSLADEILEFYYQNDNNYKFNFDLGPHAIMQTKSGKLVVSDVFIDQQNSGNVRNSCRVPRRSSGVIG